MLGARRRPYVDRVKPWNDADARPGRNPKRRGDLGAFCCRSPLQYRHIAAGDPPKSASHIAAVAHVPIYEIGSNHNSRTSGGAMTDYKSEVRDGMRIDWDVPIRMDDGLVLRADVFRPVAECRYPAIVSYGPYGKGLAFQEGYKTAWEIM